MATLFATQAPQNVDCTLIYDEYKQYYRPFTNTDFAGGYAGVDAFGRQRVSTPEAVFYAKQTNDNLPLYFDDIEETGTGTASTYSGNTSSTTLSVSASTAGKRTRQTFMRFNYQPSKSQLIFITGVLKKSGGGTGIVSRMGYFDDNNGIFLQRSGNTVSVVLRSGVTGSPVNTVVTQANWNIDQFQGAGPSGITIDFSKAQILVIDFEWLGVGRVRVGFCIDGVTFYCHEFLNANSVSTVYMTTPNLPIRYQIENDGNGVASSIECICSAVISEGGKEELGTPSYVSTDGTPITATKAYSNAILAVRLRDGKEDTTVDITNFSVLTSSNDNYEWNLVMNPSGINSLTYSTTNGSAVEYSIPANETHISGGYIIAGGYSQAKSDTAGDQLKNLLKLGTSITGKKDVIVLSCRPLGASNATVYAGLSLREF